MAVEWFGADMGIQSELYWANPSVLVPTGLCKWIFGLEKLSLDHNWSSIMSMNTAMLLMSALPLAQAKGEIPEPNAYALINMWTTLYDMDEDPQADPAGYGDPEDDMGFKIRRARMGIAGKNELIRYRIGLGMGSPYDTILQRGPATVGLVEANMGYKPLPSLLLLGGLQKVPISREQIMSSSQLVFSERAVPSVWMVPDRDVGIVADHRFGQDGSSVRLRGGVFNGNHSLYGDDNAGKLVAARAEYTYGNGSVYRSYGPVDAPTVGVGGDFYLDSDVATTTMGYGGDLIIRVSGLTLLAEVRMASLEPTNDDIDDPAVMSDTDRMGYLGQAGYSVSDFEFALRYADFDDNKDIEDAGDVSELTSGLTWHGLDDQVRIGLAYVLRLENEENAMSNDTCRLWMQLKK
jgi:hypothetical protein